MLHEVVTRTALVMLLFCAVTTRAAVAQVDLAGSWAARNHELLAGDGLPVDYTGMPLNDEARTKALSYSESQLSMIERQCQGWPAFYFVQGPFGLRIFSRHGDLLTVLAVIEDPIYLAEPWVLSKSFQLSATPVPPVGPPCMSTFEGREPGASVPHYLPEKNPFVDEMTTKYHIPREAVLGQPETLYPEYRKKLKAAQTGR